MPTLDTISERPVPEGFPRGLSTLADMLEDGINAAWRGAGTSTPVMIDAARALIALREQAGRLERALSRLQGHTTTKPWQRASDLENAINDAAAFLQGKPGPCADWVDPDR